MLTLSNQKVTINGSKIILGDTPEARLKYLDKVELDKLAELGVNAITCTVFGGDVKDISPFIGNKPDFGIDYAKLDSWLDYLTYAKSKGIIAFLMLSEKENHFALNADKEKGLIKELVTFFSDLSIIWTKEEYPTGQNARLRDVYTMLKSEIQTQSANHLIALHNNTDQINYTGNNDLIDLVQLQTKLATGNSSISKAYNAGFAVFQSELVGGLTTGNAAQWCNLGAGMSSGAGAYFAADDLKAPQYIGAKLKYEAEYKIMVMELGGTVTPPTKEPIASKGVANSALILNNTYKLQLT